MKFFLSMGEGIENNVFKRFLHFLIDEKIHCFSLVIYGQYTSNIRAIHKILVRKAPVFYSLLPA